MAITISAATKVLFIGDSITDCDWQKCPESIGKGYVRIVRDYLAARDAASAPQVFNRGISGNKITDLERRWQRDVIDLAPDVLSVYVGINDVWHGFVPDRVGCPIETYVEVYGTLLTQTRAALPGHTLVLCEPSVLWLTDPPDANDRLGPYVAAVRDLGRKFGAAVVVPLHEAFIAARFARPDIAWTTDGVHPTSFGHMLIARTWLAAGGLI